MTKDLNELISSLKKMSITFNVELITKEEFADIQEEIQDFEVDLKKFRETLKIAATLQQKNVYQGTQIMAHLYQHLGNMIQDLENIHEITTRGVQRFAKDFLEDALE